MFCDPAANVSPEDAAIERGELIKQNESPGCPVAPFARCTLHAAYPDRQMFKDVSIINRGSPFCQPGSLVSS